MKKTYVPTNLRISSSSPTSTPGPASTNSEPVRLLLRYEHARIGDVLRYSLFAQHLLSTNGWTNIPVGVEIPASPPPATLSSVSMRLTDGHTAWLYHMTISGVSAVNMEEQLIFCIEQAIRGLSLMKPTAFATTGRLPLRPHSWQGKVPTIASLSPELRRQIMAMKSGPYYISFIQKLLEGTGLSLTVILESVSNEVEDVASTRSARLLALDANKYIAHLNR